MIYLMPMTVLGNQRGPKYFKCRASPQGLPVDCSGIYFGTQNLCVITAPNLSAAQSNSLLGNPDVIGIPEDASSVGASLPALQAMLSQFGIPSSWCAVLTPWSSVIAALQAMCNLATQMQGSTNQSFVKAPPLDAQTIQAMSLAAQSAVPVVVQTVST